MNIIKQFLIEYGPMILYTILTSIMSFLGIKAQKNYEYYLNEKFKKEQANIVCQAINQLYNDLTNEEKLIKATETLKNIFAEKAIKTSNLELRLLIESTIQCSKNPPI